MSDADRRKRGQENFKKVTQWDIDLEPVDPFMRATVDGVFGDLWSRPGLTHKERRFISITCAASAGMTDETQIHMTGALKSGDVTPTEMLETILQIAHYAGWPRAASMYRQLGSICAELDLPVPTGD
ncbi:MAG: carboxymuconolactone decarboxylase family protein [Candidatus Binatia bacterium]|nr:carboxymuconolactone decarboxylase family protein [Candidatus Binatia bacterium]